MSMSKEEAKLRTARLKALREERPESVKQAQALLKEQTAARKAINSALQAGPQTVPALAAATGLPAHEVLWYISTLKKYDLVAEEGPDDMDEYYLYRLVKEDKS